MAQSVILGAARTPFGKLGGALASVPATQLGSVALRAAIERSNISPELITKTIFGQVLQGGAGQNPARQVAFGAGLGETVIAETVNRVCGSGMLAVAQADNLIRLGEHKVIAAGGADSMSGAPFIDRNARFGHRMGHAVLEDMMILDGLFCAIEHLGMGDQAGGVAEQRAIAREDQDAWAYRSHQRAIAAIDSGRMAREIVPVTVAGKRQSVVVEIDEAPRRDTSLEVLAKLPPAFSPTGTITAGNAPGVNDGGAAMLVADAAFAADHHLPISARIVAHAEAASAPGDLSQSVTLAARRVLDKAGMTVADIDLVEINEAFASVVLIAAANLGVDQDRLNVNGGAIALGHPLAASGPRILLTLIEELRARGGGFGLAAICSGGGQGDAMIVEVRP